MLTWHSYLEKIHPETWYPQLYLSIPPPRKPASGSSVEGVAFTYVRTYRTPWVGRKAKLLSSAAQYSQNSRMSGGRGEQACTVRPICLSLRLRVFWGNTKNTETCAWSCIPAHVHYLLEPRSEPLPLSPSFSIIKFVPLPVSQGSWSK